MMKYIFTLVLVFGLHIARGENTCNDVDTQACRLMVVNKPDLCNSSLGETACPRYCGMCPLECFSCPDLVQEMSQCKNVTACDLSQTCYTTEIFDFDRSHGFIGGCITKEMCVPHKGQLFGRSSSTVQTKCCDTDRCNGPPASTTAATTSIPTTSRPTTTKPSTHAHCVDTFPNLCFGISSVCTSPLSFECRRTCGTCCKL